VFQPILPFLIACQHFKPETTEQAKARNSMGTICRTLAYLSERTVEMMSDLKVAFRKLIKSPGFTVTAIRWR
jgi:hypothetical protein